MILLVLFIPIALLTILRPAADALSKNANDAIGRDRKVIDRRSSIMREIRDVQIVGMVYLLFQLQFVIKDFWFAVFWAICWRVAFHSPMWGYVRWKVNWTYIGGTKKYDQLTNKCFINKTVYRVWILIWFSLPIWFYWVAWDGFYEFLRNIFLH